MKIYSSQLCVATIAMSILVTGCGGGKLSFKNADTVIKSYTKTISDMSEKERQTFGRNMMLIMNTADTAEDELNLNDWYGAVNQASDLGYLSESDNQLVRAMASNLALEGGEHLDGKSVSYINKRGDKIKAMIAKSATKTTEDELKALQANIEKLEAEKADHDTAYQAALDAQKAMDKKVKIYKAKAKITGFSKNWSGDKMDILMSITNPHEDRVNDARADIVVEYAGYEGNYNFNLPMRFSRPQPGAEGAQKTALNLTPNSFINKDGERLDREHKFSQDKADYKLILKPNWVRTKGSLGWNEYDYKLSNDDRNAIREHTRRLKSCETFVESLKENIEKKNARLELIQDVKFDDLEQYRSWGGGRRDLSCAAR